MRERTVQETYQKKTPLQHVLLRPDTYVGSIEIEKSNKWVLYPESLQFEYSEITFVPALYKIFDEVLVNAADNYQRDHRMNLLKVEINQEEGFISVWNNGQGIPVALHKEEKIYVPELIFGHLLTGSNYNDDDKKVVGGRNGYGAKLANIFSTKFIVECGDSKKGKKFRMVWTRNMTQHSQPLISSYSGKDFTSVTFYPEFQRFRMQYLDDDICALLRKRVYDMAGLMPKVKVVLNSKEIQINSFLKYVDMYYATDSNIPKIRDANVDSSRWQIVVSLSEGEFRQVSFVNSVCTTKGGTHVNYITEQIVERIQQKILKKDKNLKVKPFQIKAHLWVFVNALIENPTFDSQTKEHMTLKQSQFGSECILSEKMIKEILKSGIVDDIFNEAKAKELNKLAKITGGGKKARVQGIAKLDDANEAGTRNSQKCTLILTEGDSAKSLAMAGLEVIGRDYFGVFPLRGKLLNVREANNKTLLANEEVQNIIKILGLQVKKEYEDRRSLRYGSIMIMSDQDTDGSHIKGLVINFIHYFWPSLFKMQGFLKQFITPLLKASKGGVVRSFFTMQDYKKWQSETPNSKQWKVKYYKGLGTSDDKEAQEYFENIVEHRIDFKYEDQEDDESMLLAFSKKKVEARKVWLGNYDPQNIMVYTRMPVRYKQFVDKEFIQFSIQDNSRSIASIIDGFKPGQRKIIYACFKRNLKKEIKVAQLSGYVAEHSAYHHGQMSLTQTIVGMAQSFVGSNNINLLMPNGQFGSRNQGGKDHASARYIFTCLNKVTREIFKQEDDHILNYMEDDGQLVEPQFYIPIIPMSIVNGCQGIGTGWSTNIPNYNPRELAQLLIKKLGGQDELKQIDPWYKGFVGEIIPKSDRSGVEVRGIVEVHEDNSTIHIRQLPIGGWTKDKKTFIQEIIQKDDSIIGLREYHTKNSVHFEVEVVPQLIEKYPNPDYYEKLFKTNGSISLKNLVGWNEQKKLHRYRNVKEIIDEFYDIRLRYYAKRKDYLLSKLQRDVQILTMKQNFIMEIIEETINIRNKKKKEICAVLEKKKYVKYSQLIKIKSTKTHGSNEKKEGRDSDDSNQSEGEGGQDLSKEYNYLLSMNLWSLSQERVEKMKKSVKEKQDQLQYLDKTPIEKLWKLDIERFLIVLDEIEEDQRLEIEKANKKLKHTNKQKKGGRKKGAQEKVKKEKKQKGKINWDSDSEVSTENKKSKKKGGGGRKKKNDSASEQQKKQEKKEEDDLISRVKKKLGSKSVKSQHTDRKSQKSDESFRKGIIVRPKKDKKTLREDDSEESEYEILRVQKPVNSRKKKRTLDSDSDEEFELDESD